jgi:hypothetical protein
VKRTAILSTVGVGVASGIAGYLVGGAYPYTVSVIGGEEPISGKIIVDFPADNFHPRKLAASVCGGAHKIAKLDDITFLFLETYRFECVR